MDKDAKIYVAGGTGPLGSAVVRRLLQAGHRNIILSKRQELNLLDQSQTFHFFQRERPEFVFLCASKSGGILPNVEQPAEFLYENLQIQNNVIEGAHRGRVKKLLFVASSSIYPENAQNPLTEDKLFSGPLDPSTEGFALAKLAGIRLCQFYKKQYGCNFISALPTNLFGINDRYDPITSHFLPSLIQKFHRARKNQEKFLTLWGTGTPRREYMDHDDCADALYFLMENYSQESPVNVGVGQALTISELAHLVMKVLGVELSIRFDGTRPNGAEGRLCDVSRLKKLGWTSKISLEEGIKKAYNDFISRTGN